MKEAVLLFGLILSLGVVGLCQLPPTVTNSTLKRFQVERLNAEREYRENYARLGFPSPEELDRQRNEDLETGMILAQQLRQARLEKERLELDRARLELDVYTAEQAAAARAAEVEQAGYYGGRTEGYGGYAGYEGYGYGGYGRYYPDGRFGQRYGRYNRGYGYGGYLPLPGGYRATAVGIYPSSGAPLPAIRRGGSWRRR